MHVIKRHRRANHERRLTSFADLEDLAAVVPEIHRRITLDYGGGCSNVWLRSAYPIAFRKALCTVLPLFSEKS